MDQRYASAVDARPAGVRRGVVFVHGVGDQRQSDTLLDFGGPLFDWLQRWYASRDEPGPTLSEVQLRFKPVDDGGPDEPARAGGEWPNGDAWVFAGAWWAASNRRSSP